MGQRRRVLLAAAMVGAPRTLLLDEPLEAVDRAMREEVLMWMEGHRVAGAALMIVTHEIEPFITTASRVVSLRDGRCFCIDPLPAEGAARIALLERLARGEDPPGESPRNGAQARLSPCEEAG
jgi:ABC-type Mn2+/Zn2+ transport system ATPase subunit